MIPKFSFFYKAYGSLLQFYDGICLWEEGSSNPVLHVTWVNHFVFSLQKFHENSRKNLHIILDDDSEESKYGEVSGSRFTNWFCGRVDGALMDKVFFGAISDICFIVVNEEI